MKCKALNWHTHEGGLCSAMGVIGNTAVTGRGPGEMWELPEDPQGQDSTAVLGSGAGGSRGEGKFSQGWGPPTI